MMRQPFLKGELLELRPLRPEDFDDLYAVAADPLIWEQHPHNTRYQEEVFWKFFQDALASGGLIVHGWIRCAGRQATGTPLSVPSVRSWVDEPA